MRRTSILLVGAAAVTVAVLGSLFGGVLTESRSTTPSAGSASDGVLENALSGFGRSGGTAATVATLEVELRSAPRDPDRLGSLGLAYQLRWRETGDPTFLPRSERVLGRALAVRPGDPSVTLGLAHLALIRHDFRKALRLGRRARLLAPHSNRPYGVIGDALLELGRYRAAFDAFDRMVALKPTVASYARVAYARELIGDVEGALAAMRLALDAAGGAPEPSAWTHVELAKLERGSGRLERAAEHLRAALTMLPGYARALEQQALIEAARGRIAQATATVRRAVTSTPSPDGGALLADLLDRQGRKAEARRHRTAVDTLEARLRANGFRVDAGLVLYRADQGIDPPATVALARLARAAAPSIEGDEALGWALVRAGRCAEGARWLDRAGRLGSRDALRFFYRGKAAECAGNGAKMRAWYRRALTLDPSFSIRWAPVAERALAAAA